MMARFREEHSNSVNYFLHVAVGWPMVAAAVLLLPLRPLWSLGLFLGGYAFMFAGHFLFERNLPSVLKRPATPVVIAWTVFRGMVRTIVASTASRRSRSTNCESTSACMPLLSDRENQPRIAIRTESVPISASEIQVADERCREWKMRAQTQFEKWSAWYQGSGIQLLFCKPTCRVLLRQLQTIPAMRVLDVGCGTGQLLVDVLRRCPDARAYGIDLAVGMVARAQHFLSSLGMSADIIRADSAQLPFAEGCFDLVMCTHSFHHYPDQAGVVGEFARVLSPGGTVMILDGDPESLWGYLLFVVLTPSIEGPVNHCFSRDISRILTAAGFTEIRQARAFPWSPVLLTIARR